MRGRKPKPTTLRLLEGNPGKRAINKDEPQPTPGAPGCPDWLSKEAKAEWRRVVPELDEIGMLKKVDRGALAAYCAAWARMVQADRDVQEHGSVIIVPTQELMGANGSVTLVVQKTVNPATRLFKDAAVLVRAFASEFGLTPSARTRLEQPRNDDDDEVARKYLT